MWQEPERKESEQEQETSTQQTEPHEYHPVYYGQTVEVELVNWEEKFQKHVEEMAQIEKEREERIEDAQKKEKSWELLRECRKFLMENEKNWKIESEERRTKTTKKAQRLKDVERKKELLKESLVQKKITDTWQQLPEAERKKLQQEDERKRLLELREVKVNIWKKWRGRQEENKRTEDKNKQERKLEKLEEILARIKREDAERQAQQERENERRKEFMHERNKKIQEKKRQAQEKKDRLQKKKILEDRWAMTKWITEYIDSNSEKWEKEKTERKETEKRRRQEWARMTRLEKIRMIKENEIDQNKVHAKIHPAKLHTAPECNTARPNIVPPTTAPQECGTDQPLPRCWYSATSEQRKSECSTDQPRNSPPPQDYVCSSPQPKADQPTAPQEKRTEQSQPMLSITAECSTAQPRDTPIEAKCGTAKPTITPTRTAPQDSKTAQHLPRMAEMASTECGITECSTAHPRNIPSGAECSTAQYSTAHPPTSQPECGTDHVDINLHCEPHPTTQYPTPHAQVEHVQGKAAHEVHPRQKAQHRAQDKEVCEAPPHPTTLLCSAALVEQDLVRAAHHHLRHQARQEENYNPSTTIPTHPTTNTLDPSSTSKYISPNCKPPRLTPGILVLNRNIDRQTFTKKIENEKKIEKYPPKEKNEENFKKLKKEKTWTEFMKIGNKLKLIQVLDFGPKKSTKYRKGKKINILEKRKLEIEESVKEKVKKIENKEKEKVKNPSKPTKMHPLKKTENEMPKICNSPIQKMKKIGNNLSKSSPMKIKRFIDYFENSAAEQLHRSTKFKKNKGT